MDTQANDTEAALHPLPARTRTYFLVLLTIIYALSFLDRQIINILAEPIKEELHLADWQMGLMSGFAFALLYTVLGLPVARLSERRNRTWIIGTALTVWSGFTALSGMAQNFVQLLLARIGVGIGEAGLIPPAHSLITDITPREKRASALAFFSMGLPLGTLLGMALGGVIAELYGWRTAFLVVGIPGIFLAALLVLTAKDPRAEAMRSTAQDPVEIPPLKETLRLLWAARSFRWLTLGAALIAFTGYGHQTFYGSFYLRNHGAGLDGIAAAFGFEGRLAILGIALGLILGISAMAGTGYGGRAGDKNARSGAAGYLNVPIWATGLAVPFLIACFLVQDVRFSLLLLAIPSFLKAMWYGPVYACLQSIVPARSRATAVAVFLFLVNMIGLGAGPVLTGAMSDVLAKSFGPDEGLRIAMIILSAFVLLAVGCFALARRTIAADFRS